MMRKISVWKLVAGVVLAGLGLFMLTKAPGSLDEQARWWAQNSLPATGTVTGVENDYRNRAYCEYPVIAFRANDGRDYTFTTRGVMCYSRGTFPVGRQVAVTYQKGNPTHAYIDLPAHDRATEIAVYAIAVLTTLAGALLLYLAIRKKSEGTGA